MRQSSPPDTFDKRLSEEKARTEAQLKVTEPGAPQDLLRRKLEQIETASRNEQMADIQRFAATHVGSPTEEPRPMV